MINTLYPKNNKELIEKCHYYIENEQNPKKIKDLENWLKWYKTNDKKNNYQCTNNEFFKWFIEDRKCSLQVWKHNDETNIDEISFNLISNYYDIYNTEETIIVD